MSFVSLSKRTALTGVAALAAFAAACTSSPTTPNVAEVDAVAAITTDNTPAAGEVKVCKFFYTTASTASDPANGTADFTVSASGGNVVTSSFSLNSGECEIVWRGSAGTVTVTELTSGKPYEFFRGFVYDQNFGLVADIENAVSTVTIGGGVSGASLWFKNTPKDLPPPPQEGEGCTPGYWRQSQHFGNYTAPITPSTPFESVFANYAGFPNNGTWLQALTLKGGKFNSLIRHTAAAYLNSLSANVDYDLSPAQVIATYNNAVATGNWDEAKNIFEGLNEQGCPLGRAE